MSGRRAHRSATILFSLLMAAIGVALIAQALGGGSGVSIRLLLGVLFTAGGVGRMYLESRRGGRT